MNTLNGVPPAYTMPARFKREMTRHPGSFNPKLPPAKQYKFDGKGAWAPNSSTPPCGWPVAIAIGMGVVGLLIFGASYVGAAVGF